MHRLTGNVKLFNESFPSVNVEVLPDTATPIYLFSVTETEVREIIDNLPLKSFSGDVLVLLVLLKQINNTIIKQ